MIYVRTTFKLCAYLLLCSVVTKVMCSDIDDNKLLLDFKPYSFSCATKVICSDMDDKNKNQLSNDQLLFFTKFRQLIESHIDRSLLENQTTTKEVATEDIACKFSIVKFSTFSSELKECLFSKGCKIFDDTMQTNVNPLEYWKDKEGLNGKKYQIDYSDGCYALFNEIKEKDFFVFNIYRKRKNDAM